MTKHKINPNLKLLVSSKDKKRGVILEGSSRSGKTFSCIDFIVYLCSKVETNCTINIIKETYNSFKTTIYDDFNRRLPDYNIYSPFADRKEVDSFKIFGNKINLLGADKPSKFHGASCDYFWINEALDVQQDIFDQSEMRCRKFWFMDYNPKLTQHWIYDKIENRPDTILLRTTFLDNPFISKAERSKILGYEPTPENISNGTADDYLWSVYGLGKRCAPEGLIFRYVNYLDKWPEDIAPVLGMDFGFTTDPSALVRVGENKTDIFLELLMYEPTDTPSIIDNYAKAKGLNISTPCTADSSDKYTGENKGTVEMVRGLKDLGWNISKVSKTKSIMYWLGKMKEKKINVINNNLVHHFKKEFENYRLKTVNGIAINQPIDGFDHAISGGRYGYMSLQQNRQRMW